MWWNMARRRISTGKPISVQLAVQETPSIMPVRGIQLDPFFLLSEVFMAESWKVLLP
ncbi:hypothetical protein D3C73_1340470 [compost metagenome]